MLGFILNSKTMTAKPTQQKIESVLAVCQKLLSKKKPTIRSCAKALGTMISCFPGILYGPLYYRQLEKEKTEALKMNKGDFESFMSPSPSAKLELEWWIRNISLAFKPLTRENPVHVIKTDASLEGWGAFYNETTAGGIWSLSEKENSINYLEMKAVLFGLQTFAKEFHETHIKVLSDNTTTVSVLNNMGTSHSKKCNDMCKEIWEWCIGRNIWLTLAHIPGKDNIEADSASRKKENTSTEWQLQPKLLHSCLKQLDFYPNIDLFATRINRQFPCFLSFKPDPEAFAVDAFTIDWSTYKIYAFPPFSMIPRVLRKIQDDNAKGTCVLPNWPTQPWFPRAKKLMLKPPIILNVSQNVLLLPNRPEVKHTLFKKLQMIVCLLSAKN